VRREIYNYQKQPPSEHLDNLEKYLRVAPYLIPDGNKTLIRPTLRHPDLQPNNVFISDNLSITSFIDWQHCSILPLFLQCGIPNSFQNYGDAVSESLERPDLPSHFDELSDREQFEEVLLLRRHQLHFFYVATTARFNLTHYDALAHDFSVLRRKTYDHASSPWEGDSVTLKSDLIDVVRKWAEITTPESSTRNGARPSCPITFSEEEADECVRLSKAQVEADEQMQTCRDIIGVGTEGWVPTEQYDEVIQRANEFKAAALEAAESEEERQRLCEHWIFDDFDEDEYS
jgi:hypothetical protein